MTAELTYLAKRSLAGVLSRRAFLGRAAAVGLSTVFAQSLLTTAAQAAGPVKGGHLKIGMQGGDFSNKIDPALAYAPVPLFNLRCLGDTLVEVEADGALTPRLALDIDRNAEATEWKFKIRQDVIFHNGRTLLAEDVKATLARHLDEKTGSAVRGLVSNIKELSVEGDVVSITLHTPEVEFAWSLADPRLAIQPEEALGSAIYSGGYVMKVNEPGVRHLMERHEHYWDDSRAHVAQIEVLVINDPQLRMANLSTGQVHLVNRADPHKVGEFTAMDGIVLARAQGWQAPAFVMQASAKPYESAELRLAIKHAVDRQAILDGVFAGMGTIGNDLPLHNAWANDLAGVKQRNYDPERAAWHFNNAMHDGAPMVLRASDMAYIGAVGAAQMLQATATAANIPLEMRREEPDNYWPEVWNRQPFAASLLPSAPTPSLALAAYASSCGVNESRFVSPRYDEVLIQSRRENDALLRREMQSEMAQILGNEAGLVVAAHADVLDLHAQALAGYQADGRGELMGGFAGVKTWLTA